MKSLKFACKRLQLSAFKRKCVFYGEKYGLIDEEAVFSRFLSLYEHWVFGKKGFPFCKKPHLS